jgi:hypothetical protein
LNCVPYLWKVRLLLLDQQAIDERRNSQEVLRTNLSLLLWLCVAKGSPSRHSTSTMALRSRRKYS